MDKKQKEKEEAKKDFFAWVRDVRERTKDMDSEILARDVEEAVQVVKKHTLLIFFSEIISIYSDTSGIILAC